MSHEAGTALGVADAGAKPDVEEGASGALAGAAAHLTLAQLQPHFAYFTVAALFTRGKLDYDPVEKFMVEGDIAPGPIMRLKFDRPMFRGLGQWDHYLWACRKDLWADLSTEIRGVAWHSRPDREFYSVEPGSAVLPDPRSLAGRPENIYVTTFGVTGNKCRYGFNTEVPPRLTSLTVDPTVVKMADLLFANLG